MSRLIFEGDTTKRFGEKFPRPFIEQIRAYDNGVQVDIAFYFKVPNEQEAVNAFREDLTEVEKFSQSIVLSAVDDTTLNKLKSSKNFDSLLQSFQSPQVSIETSEPGVIKTKTIDFSQFLNYQDDFYNLEGERFLKIYEQIDIDYNSSGEMYITCFTKNGLGSIYYDGQTSDLTFEKLLNEDRTISTDPIIAFLEQNGNFYYQTPLMDLARTYHKTDDYGHTELIKQFSDVIQNYSLDESDDLLATLDKQKDNPRLLIILKNKIDGFTDKSPATALGRLYSQMASNIVLADTLISRQERVSKRQFTNTKLKDFREQILPNLQKKETYSDYYPTRANNESFLPTPLLTRNIIPVLNVSSVTDISLDPPPENFADYFKIETSGYYFFDYEKVLNYKSQISRFLNPYNIEQIYGKGCLQEYFNIKTVVLEKSPYKSTGRPDSTRKKTLTLLPSSKSITQIDLDENINYHRLVGSVGEVKTQGYRDVTSVVFSPENELNLYTSLMQRGFDTIEGLNGYRLALFELKDYQKSSPVSSNVLDGLETIQLEFSINISDSTMEFYETYIRQKIFSILNAFKKYRDFANDFCSYKEVDNKFNDFFVQQIKNEFEQPYPWEEAPFYYHAFNQMILASRRGTFRKRAGTLLDLDSIDMVARQLRKTVSPETGDIDSIETFHTILQSFVKDYFEKDSGLDKNNEIYTNDTSQESYTLVNPLLTLKFSRVDKFHKSLITANFPIGDITGRSDMTCEELNNLYNQEWDKYYAGEQTQEQMNIILEILEILREKDCDIDVS